jgi:hypothetical protein
MARESAAPPAPPSRRAGVAFVWIIAPVDHLVQVFAGQNGKPVLVTTASDEESARLPPFDVPIDVRRLWTSPTPG